MGAGFSKGRSSPDRGNVATNSILKRPKKTQSLDEESLTGSFNRRAQIRAEEEDEEWPGDGRNKTRAGQAMSSTFEEVSVAKDRLSPATQSLSPTRSKASFRFRAMRSGNNNLSIRSLKTATKRGANINNPSAPQSPTSQRSPLVTSSRSPGASYVKEKKSSLLQSDVDQGRFTAWQKLGDGVKSDNGGPNDRQAWDGLHNLLDHKASLYQNAMGMLQDLVRETQDSMTARERVRLDYVMTALETAENQPSNDKATAGMPEFDLGEEDKEVADWLMEAFIGSPKHRVKKSLKTVVQAIIAGRRLKMASNFKEEALPPLPFECETPAEYEAITGALEGMTDWNWNIFKLREASRGRELSTICWHCLRHYDLPAKFGVRPETLRNFLEFLEDEYLETEYHNCTHAADVVQGCFFLLTACKAEKYLTEIEIFSLLVGAMCHDVGHDGFNNVYHQKAFTERARAHNDQSIQENFHCALLFEAVTEFEDINIFNGLTKEQFAEVRRMVINVILSTDMSKHFTFVGNLKDAIETKGQCPEKWSESTDLMMHAIVHLADISNPCRPHDQAVAWAERVLMEFFKQGRMEEQMGYPISPNCNEKTTSMASCQIGFIKFIVMPTFKVLGTLLPEVEEIVCKQLGENFEYWQSISVKEKSILEQAKSSGQEVSRKSVMDKLVPKSQSDPVLSNLKEDIPHARRMSKDIGLMQRTGSLNLIQVMQQKPSFKLQNGTFASSFGRGSSRRLMHQLLSESTSPLPPAGLGSSRSLTSNGSRSTSQARLPAVVLEDQAMEGSEHNDEGVDGKGRLSSVESAESEAVTARIGSAAAVQVH